jgi:hypothetical protein
VKLLIPDGEEAYVLVGGDRMVGDDGVNNYLDLLYVRNDDGGAVTFTVNTRLVGTDVPSQWAYASGGDTVVSYDHRHGGDADPAETTAFASAAFVDSDGHTVAETLAGLREAVDVTTLPRPLQSARYRLVAGGDDTVVVREDPETPDMANPLARTNLVLTDPEVSNVTTYVAPRASAHELTYGDEQDTRLTPGNLDRVLDRTTRRDAVARGDRLVVEVEATGLYGALLASAGPPAELGAGRAGDPVVDDGVGPAVLADLLGYHEGISLTVTETNPGQNTRETRLRLRDAAEGDVYVVPDTGPPNSQGAAIERFYVVFDTRATAPFTDPLDDGDRFEFEFAYESPPNERYAFGDGTPPAPFDPRNRPTENGTEHFPYLGDRETTDSERATFAVEAPSVQYDNRTVDGDEVVVSDGTEATLAGETNVAPGSDVTIQLVSKERTPPKVITIDDVTVEPDGSFSVTRDLSTLDPGANVEVEFYVYQQLVDKRPAVVVDESQNPVAFEVVDLTGEATVARGGTLGDVSVTIRNTGVLDGRESIEFRLDGETVSQRRILVNRGDDWTGRFAGVAADLDPGEYRYTVVTPDDEASGTLVVTATAGNATASTPTETTPAGETTPLEYAPGENSPSEREAPERLPESSSGGFPGVGFVRPRDALGGIALVGAVYVVGNWV